MEQTAINQACEAVGGQSKLAALIGVSRQAISIWVQRNRVPAIRVLRIEAVSGISRHELRPDIYPPTAI